MSKERDWIDYANLGSNIFQNLQLSGVQNQLGQMASMAATEQAMAARENAFREAVFQGDTMLRKMRALPKEDRQRVLVLVRENMLNFERYGLTSDAFRSYDDKERLRGVLEGHEALVDDCSKDLTSAERDEVELCVQYRPEQEELELLVKLYPKYQELLAARAELGSSSEAPSAGATGSGTLGGVVGLIAVALVVFGAVMVWLGKGSDLGKEFADSQLESMGYVVLCFGGFLVVFRIIRKALLLNKATGPSQQSRVRELEAFDPRLISRIPILIVKFGNKPLEELTKMRDEREALIARVMGVQLKHQGIEPPPPPPSGLSSEVVKLARNPSTKIAAIMLYREQNPGVGLADAKAKIDAIGEGRL